MQIVKNYVYACFDVKMILSTLGNNTKNLKKSKVTRLILHHCRHLEAIQLKLPLLRVMLL